MWMTLFTSVHRSESLCTKITNSPAPAELDPAPSCRVRKPSRRRLTRRRGLGGRWRAFREARAAARIRLEHLLRSAAAQVRR
jgi:hypothetical protein